MRLVSYLRERPNSTVTQFLRRAKDNLLFRPYSRVIPLNRLLLGGEEGIPAAQYARMTCNLLRPSTLIANSPHVQFLQQYLSTGDDIFHSEVFRSTAYFKNAAESISVLGRYCTCTKEDEIQQVARRFLAQFLSVNNGNNSNSSSEDHCFAAADTPVKARPIHDSDCYEVLNGHHRLAIDYVRGIQMQQVLVVPPGTTTPLQQLLLDQVPAEGTRIIYQPLNSPELADKWDLVRCCTDRFDLMRKFLTQNRLTPPHCRTYLDIPCSYGWFVRAFRELGYDASGVERDWASCEIARIVFGLGTEKLIRSEVVRFLAADVRKYDITSCLSLLHHFVLGRGSVSAEEMLRLVDEKTKAVFFFDTGQGHEEWFRESLAEWDPDHIEQWIRKYSSFKRIYRLGVDQDNRAPFERNYRRTLFACMR